MISVCKQVLILRICWIENWEYITGEPENATFYSVYLISVFQWCAVLRKICSKSAAMLFLGKNVAEFIKAI